MKVISLYTGAGGLDLGLEASGFETAVAVEFDDDTVRTLRHKRGWKVIHGDIHSEDASSKNILATAGLEPREATLLSGGPPCQPFSKSGYWSKEGFAKKTGSRRLNDPRAKTLEAYLRVLRDTLPEMFLLENVPGMAFNEKSEGLQLLRQEIAKINEDRKTHYSFVAAQLNAAEYGIPQARERVFVIGHREGKEFRFPSPTHTLPPRRRWDDGVDTALDYVVPEGMQRALTAWDAIGHLADDDTPDLKPRGKWADLLVSIPEGQNYLHHTPRGAGLPIFGWRTRYWSMDATEAGSEPAVLDSHGVSGASDRTVPLEVAPPVRARTRCAPDVPRRLRNPRRRAGCIQTARERRSVRNGGGHRPCLTGAVSFT